MWWSAFRGRKDVEGHCEAVRSHDTYVLVAQVSHEYEAQTPHCVYWVVRRKRLAGSKYVLIVRVLFGSLFHTTVEISVFKERAREDLIIQLNTFPPAPQS